MFGQQELSNNTHFARSIAQVLPPRPQHLLKATQGWSQQQDQLPNQAAKSPLFCAGHCRKAFPVSNSESHMNHVGDCIQYLVVIQIHTPVLSTQVSQDTSTSLGPTDFQVIRLLENKVLEP